MRAPRGVSSLVPAQRTPARRKSFFAPVFSFFPASFSALKTFRLWPGGSQSVGPVNMASSWSGINITPELSLQISAVWACVWRYANTVSTLPFQVMRTVGTNHAELYREHPLYTILHDRPNTQMSAVKFWQAFTASMMSWGFGIAKKLTVGGRLVGLEPWRPEFVTTYLDENKRLRFRYYPNAGPGNPIGENVDVSADEVFVVLDRSMDGYSALSRIQYGANSMSLAVGADRAANLSYRNGLRASGILTIAQWLKPAQREAYKTIVNEFVGTGNGDENDRQFGVMVAENATKFEPLSLNPIDVELLASRRYSVEDLCRWYDVPPILVGHAGEGQTMWGSGIEQIILGWIMLGLRPIVKSIEAEVWRQLISVDDRALGIYAEFNLDALMRGDSAARAAFYSTMTQNGIYTRNEARGKENLRPMPGGDELTVQSALVPLDKLGKVTTPPPQVAKDASTLDLNVKTLDGAGDLLQEMKQISALLKAHAAPRKWKQTPIRDADGRIVRTEITEV